MAPQRWILVLVVGVGLAGCTAPGAPAEPGDPSLADSASGPGSASGSAPGPGPGSPGGANDADPVHGAVVAADAEGWFRASSTDAVVLRGHDTWGRSARPGHGGITLDLHPDRDAGAVQAGFRWEGRQWNVSFTRFQAPGGVEDPDGIQAGIRAHGAAAHPPDPLPEVHAVVAAWGEGEATVDGEPFVDPATGSRLLDLALVLTDTAPWHPLKHRVLSTSGRPYDLERWPEPAVLHDAHQVLLDVRSLGANFGPDHREDFRGEILDVDHRRDIPFEVRAGASAVWVNVTFTSHHETLIAGAPSMALRGPSGEAEETRQMVPVLQGHQGTWFARVVLPAPVQEGRYVVEVGGAGADIDYLGRVDVDYPEPLFLHAVFNDLQPRAAS